MNSKINILEELNKMKNLINAKAGTVISEQSNSEPRVLLERDAIVNDGSDLQTIKGVLSKLGFKPTPIKFEKFIGADGIRINTNQGIFDFTTYKPGGYFKRNNFVLQNKNGVKTMGTWDYDKLFMKNSGVVDVMDKDFNNIISLSELKPLTNKSTDNWKIKFPCVPTQPGAKSVKLSDGTTAYVIGKVVYYSNGRKKLSDGTMSNYNCNTEFKGGTGKQDTGKQDTGKKQKIQSVRNRFSQSAKSLGIQNGKMDIQTLQTMLNSLESDTPIQTTAQNTPDLAQLTAALNQLNA